MARISGVDIPREKRLEISLTYIFGIGRTRSKEICDGVGISRDTRVRDLTEEEVAQLRAYVDGNLKVEGDLRREIAADIKRKVEIGSYEGLRHRRGLPVRGQRTRTNARTRKGPKKTVARRAMEHGVRKVDVMVKGPGSGRETAIRTIQNTGIEVVGIKDVTPIPHNGCRPAKRRRV